jgi:hypothetical protein
LYEPRSDNTNKQTAYLKMIFLNDFFHAGNHLDSCLKLINDKILDQSH